MKKMLVMIFICVVVLLSIKWQEKDKNNTIPIIRTWLISELRSITQQLLLNSDKKYSLAQLRHAYKIARMHYKQIEFFIEYCSPLEAKYFINGPLVPKHDEEFGIRYPQGFQRIEELLFTNTIKADTALLHNEYNLLIKQLSAISDYYSHIELPEGLLLEMCQLELFRIAALNLNGYDATISQANVTESAYCIEGINTVVTAFKWRTDKDVKLKSVFNSLLQQLANAKAYLLTNKDYNTFNRLQFITAYINSINSLLVQFHTASKLPWSTNKQALDLKQVFLFGKESFNSNYFSMYYNDTINLAAQANLGKLLFFDPALSGNNQRSCANCHNPGKGFTDGLQKSIAVGNKGIVMRNAPTLLNVIYQKAFFYDGRAYQLEQQAFDVIHNQNEMQSSLDDVIKKLHTSTAYVNLFKSAFSGTVDTSITQYALQKALTEYEKTLVSFNSRFDRYLRGNLASLTQQEINGYNLFSGKALCGSCHFLPLFNGTVPPFYTDSEFEVIGVPADSNNIKLDVDKGRFNVTHLQEHLNAFKTPTIRNIALTAPYMHNGVYRSLDQVIEFYHRGGGNGLGFKIPNQTLPFDSLKLNTEEKNAIVLFMKVLTDTTGTIKNPESLPEFDNATFLNNRSYKQGH